MKKTFWLLACFGILSACSCHKKAVEPVFQNSFSCKVNGQLWEPVGPDGFFGADKTLGFFFSPNEVGLGIQAKNRLKNQTMNITCFCKDTTGIYLMRSEQPFNDYNLSCSYLPDTSKGRVIVFTKLDKDKRILKGTFEFIALNTGNCKDTLKFTDGKFELNY